MKFTRFFKVAGTYQNHPILVGDWRLTEYCLMGNINKINRVDQSDGHNPFVGEAPKWYWQKLPKN